jgi:hypothetical protein
VSFDPPFPPADDAPGAPPPLPPPDPPPPQGGSPWDRRDQIGFGGALVETTQQVLLQPRHFYERMFVTGGVGGPLLYAVILGYIGVVANTVYNAVFSSIVGSSFPQLMGERPELERLLEVYGTWVGALGQLVTGPVWIAIGAFVGAGILHLVLMLLGGASADFEATFRVVAFAHAINVITLVPFCGSFVALVWWVIVASIGLSVVHRISMGRAVLAVLLPVLLCCCCCAGAFGLLASSMAAALGQVR